MEPTVEHGGNRRPVAKQLFPVLHRTIQYHQGAGPSIATHDDFREILGHGRR